jgi:PIN domain nuclease of toxin-antitoxin system
VRVLLDTHIWIWLLEDPQRIAAPVLQQLEAADTLVLSVASLCEIAIKTELGRLEEMTASPDAMRDEILHEMRAQELVIHAAHAFGAARLPKLHKDPFDRMLIAQAQIEHLILATADETIRQYGGAVLWAI